MRISASEYILFCNPTEQNVERLHELVPEIELMLDGDAWDSEEEDWQKKIGRLKNSRVPFTVHPPAWDVNPAAPVREIREAAAKVNRHALEVCRELGVKQVVYHPGYYDKRSRFSRKLAWKRSYELLEELVTIAKPQGITIAYENIGGPAVSLFTQEEYIHALDDVDPCVKYLLVVGHAHINGWDIPEVIDALSDRLCGLHLHDNDGAGDSHLPIGQGTIPWEDVFASMKCLSPECVFVLEYAPGTPLAALEVGRELLREKLY